MDIPLIPDFRLKKFLWDMSKLDTQHLPHFAGLSRFGPTSARCALPAVEKRFGMVRAPHPIQHLSDNGGLYTGKKTRNFAAALNLAPCFMTVRSPPSNGMLETFVKALKRDCLGLNPLPDTRTSAPADHRVDRRLQRDPLTFSAPDALAKIVHPRSNPLAGLSAETGWHSSLSSSTLLVGLAISFAFSLCLVYLCRKRETLFVATAANQPLKPAID